MLVAAWAMDGVRAIAVYPYGQLKGERCALFPQQWGEQQWLGSLSATEAYSAATCGTLPEGPARAAIWELRLFLTFAQDVSYLANLVQLPASRHASGLWLLLGGASKADNRRRAVRVARLMAMNAAVGAPLPEPWAF
eukprot:10460125-Lingulodinium_polyedra.AAC.1